jgi:hypothetical protein
MATTMCTGQYVTDGTRLLRIVTALGLPPHGGLLELEDCRSLEVLLVSVDDLRRLRRVWPSIGPAAAAA